MALTQIELARHNLDNHLSFAFRVNSSSGDISTDDGWIQMDVREQGRVYLEIKSDAIKYSCVATSSLSGVYLSIPNNLATSNAQAYRQRSG